MSNKVVVSGGFDPIHYGHVRMIQGASLEGEVVVVINSDDWLIRKKGFYFMSWDERAEIVRSIKGVTAVSRVEDTDGSVCEAISRLHAEGKCGTFANGGDRTATNTPEIDLCEKLGIKLLWGVGGGKIQSSSNLVDRASYESGKFENFLKRG
jgi:D-beta-D-heptose 7-phosphate kinase/D-beta-D-heptose 1-phosphate adenosyltransferase